MTYCFDLDGTLCNTEGTGYENSTPMPDRIAVVNQLFDQGHDIIIDTARGFVFKARREEIRALTIRQLREWGVKYHLLRVGEKPAADRYIDDKGVNDRDFFPSIAPLVRGI